MSRDELGEIRLECSYINEHGETMIMAADEKYNVFVFHNDCTDDFVPLAKFNFIVTKEERIVLHKFIDMVVNLLAQ